MAGTRTLPLHLRRTDHVVFLTQTGILKNENAIEVLFICVVIDPQVGAAYGGSYLTTMSNIRWRFARQ